jgi:hypothetical protein
VTSPPRQARRAAAGYLFEDTGATKRQNDDHASLVGSAQISVTAATPLGKSATT